MSTEPSLYEQPESRSKVKLTRNAKGDAQWEISVVEGTDAGEMNRLREMALAVHRQLIQDLVPQPRPAGSSAA